MFCGKSLCTTLRRCKSLWQIFIRQGHRQANGLHSAAFGVLILSENFGSGDGHFCHSAIEESIRPCTRMLSWCWRLGLQLSSFRVRAHASPKRVSRCRTARMHERTRALRRRDDHENALGIFVTLPYKKAFAHVFVWYHDAKVASSFQASKRAL